MAKVKEINPWDEMRTIIVPKKRNGDQECINGSVNGRPFQVPCTGRPQEVPLPVYEALMHSQEMQEEAEERAAQRKEKFLESARKVNMA